MPAERSDFQSVRAPQIVRKSRPDEFLDSTASVLACSTSASSDGMEPVDTGTDGAPDATSGADRGAYDGTPGNRVSTGDALNSDTSMADAGGVTDARACVLSDADDMGSAAGACYDGSLTISASTFGSWITPTCMNSEPPQMQGGTIEDGTYVLQSVSYYGTCPSIQPTLTNWFIAGDAWAALEVVEVDDAGNIAIMSAAYSAVMADNEVILCPTCIQRIPNAIDTRTFTASPKQLTFTAYQGGTWTVATFVNQ
jgi:hypothetical protein